MDRSELPRRDLLGILALGAGVAGCTSLGGDDGSTDDEATGDAEGPGGTDGTADEADGSNGADEDTGDGDPGGDGAATVTVDPGRSAEFDPASVSVDPGETVVWEWDSDFHNVVVESSPDGAEWDGQPWDETFDAGHTYEHTFDVEGAYDYYCQPHRESGSVGEVLVGDAVSRFDGTIVVGPDGRQEFDPDVVTIESGTTVSWEWDSDFHNVVVESQPEDADWAGHEPDETYDAGHTYEHTFEVAGTYEYYCQPHRAQRMTGTIHVEAE